LDSGEVRSTESLGISYAGPALRSGQRCFWKVRVWDGQGRPQAGARRRLGNGSPRGTPWQGRWISDGKPVPKSMKISTGRSGPLVRKEFVAPERIARRASLSPGSATTKRRSTAGAWVTMSGPGLENYEKRVFYSVYDVTDLSGQAQLRRRHAGQRLVESLPCGVGEANCARTSVGGPASSPSWRSKARTARHDRLDRPGLEGPRRPGPPEQRLPGRGL